MIGAVIGDIVGSVYEFHNLRSVDFPFFSPEGFFTDDSVMTVAVARALLFHRHDLFRKRFARGSVFRR